MISGTIEVEIEADAWTAALPEAETVVRRAATAALGTVTGDVVVLLTDDGAVRDLNARFRDKDRPTNVLSFPAFPVTPGKMPGPMLGDIIFAEETLTREAADLGKSFDDHLTHLMVHGFLHLFGYDHMEDEEAEKMEGLETRILAELGLSDPYGDGPEE